MIKRRTKKDIFEDYADAISNIRQGRPPKRSCNKDGSISTKPVISVELKPEAEVLKNCIKWLKNRGVFCNRHDVGVGDIKGRGWATYGIIGGGDIIGLLPNGRHFEIECKKGKGGRLSKAQQKRMKNIIHNKGIYLIVHGVEELEYLIGEYLND